MNLIPDAKYAESHEWARWDGEEIVCGISDHAQESLSDIVYVELPDVGDELDAGDIFGVVESVKAASDVYMPMSGQITAVNETLEDSPEIVNQDPYGAGWLIRFRPIEPEQYSGLLEADAYEALVSEEES
jgi:glycine cleavage system H protein